MKRYRSYQYQGVSQLFPGVCSGMTLIYQGERYRLDSKNKAILCQTHQEFEQISTFEELYHCHVYSV